MKVLCSIFLLSLPMLSFAQNKQTADSLYRAQSWSPAVKAYKNYLKKHKNDSSAWFNLGMSYMNQNDAKAAIEVFLTAKENNYPVGQVNLALAKASILAGNEESMYKYLEAGANSGLGAYAFIKSEPSFSTYLDKEPFVKILERVKLNAYPCLSSKNYRHFDFWLGTWDVFANGRKTGVNVISMAEGGCAIHESYTTAGNYSGQSINYYDPIDEKWHQHWVGSGGDVYNYLETDRGPGMLQFESKFMGANGQISLSRLTFTLNEDGTVRQLFESSADEGNTWTPAFDGLYKKKNE